MAFPYGLSPLIIKTIKKGWEVKWHTKDLYYGMTQLLIQITNNRTYN
ncbi:hypothetical protein EMIT019CA3_20319 [Bacillus pseudomycoides]